MKNALIGTALALALAGCMSTESRMLDSSTAIISGKATWGGQYVSNAALIQRTLQEAAKTTRANGFRYFSIAATQDTSRTVTTYDPGQTYTSGTVTAGPFGNSATYSGTTFSTPGTATSGIVPGADLVIKMFKDGEADPRQHDIWDADEILATETKAES